jgi:hypothetical protein
VVTHHGVNPKQTYLYRTVYTAKLSKTLPGNSPAESQTSIAKDNWIWSQILSFSVTGYCLKQDHAK